MREKKIRINFKWNDSKKAAAASPSNGNEPEKKTLPFFFSLIYAHFAGGWHGWIQCFRYTFLYARIVFQWMVIDDANKADQPSTHSPRHCRLVNTQNHICMWLATEMNINRFRTPSMQRYLFATLAELDGISSDWILMSCTIYTQARQTSRRFGKYQIIRSHISRCDTK